jgi:sugar phosphate isomerase/epimerase
MQDRGEAGRPLENAAPSGAAERGPSRREVLRLLSAAVVGSMAVPRVVDALERLAPTSAPLVRARPPIGVQLYTVRSLMTRDVPGTFAALAAAGIREVEFAGYFNRSATELRGLLTQHGLTAPAAHVPIPSDWSPVMDDAEALGHRWLVVPWVGNEVRASLDGWRKLADQLNTAGALAKRRGLRVAYHNHDFEFAVTEGRVAYDVLVERLDPSLVDLELDLYWAVKSGQDPQALFARLPGRFPLWHLKDAGPAPDRTMTEVGSGTIDFAGLFARAEQSGLQHAFIEHDEPRDALASVQSSAAALKRMP